MTAPVVIAPSVGAGWPVRVAARVRRLFSRRVLLRLAGVPTVVLQGHVYAVRAVPLGVARDMVPALLRCSRILGEQHRSIELSEDFIVVLLHGLRVNQSEFKSFKLSIDEQRHVLDEIAWVNGIPVIFLERSCCETSD